MTDDPVFSARISATIAEAIQAAKAGDKNKARQLLSQVVRDDPRNARGWYLLSQVIGDQNQAVMCLKKVLEIQPENAQARERLRKLQGSQVEEEPALDATVRRMPPPAAAAEQPYQPIELPPYQANAAPVNPAGEPVGTGGQAGGGPVMGGGFEEKPVKSGGTRWTVILIVLGVLAACCICLAVGSALARNYIGNILPFQDQPANVPITGSSADVVYRAEGDGPAATITFVKPDGGTEQIANVPLPWEKSYTMPAGQTASVIVQTADPASKVTCVIEVDGAEVVRQESSLLPMAACITSLGAP